MACRLTRSVSPLLRKLLPSSSSSASSPSSSSPSSSSPAALSSNCCFATLSAPTEGSNARLLINALSCQQQQQQQQHQSKRGRLLTAQAYKEGVRQASGGGGGGGGGGKDDVGKDDKAQDDEFTEKDWERVMGRQKYVKRPTAIHDYKEPDNFTGQSLETDEYSIADQENLLTTLRRYKPHPIGPWSWTPLEEIRDPPEAVRQHGPTCPCELCVRAKGNYEQAAYLTKCEVMEEPFVLDVKPETVVKKTKPRASSEQRNIWEEGLPSPPWLDDTYPPRYARQIRLLYNQDHPWLKGMDKDAMAPGGEAADSPGWLDSSYPPEYAKQIRSLYRKQKAEKSSGKK